MRKFLTAALILAVAATVADDSATDWYLPEKWTNRDVGQIMFESGGVVHGFDIATDGSGLAYTELYDIVGEDPITATAVYAMIEALRAQMMVDYMAQQLNGLFEQMTADISTDDSDLDNDKGVFQISPGAKGGKTVTISGIKSVKADDSSTEKTQGKIGLKGWSTGSPGTSPSTLGGILTGRTQDVASYGGYQVLARPVGGGSLTYMGIGYALASVSDDDTIKKRTLPNSDTGVFYVPEGRFVDRIVGTGPIMATADGRGSVTLAFAGEAGGGGGGGGGGLFPDGVSLAPVVDASTGKTNMQIVGWASQESCGANLHDMLVDPANSDRGTHELLCRVNGELHYLPLGTGVMPTPDDVTITEDATTHKLSVKPGTEGMFLKSSSSGTAWAYPVTSVTGDQFITPTKTDGVVALAFSGYTGENGVTVSGGTISGSYTGSNGVTVSGGTISGAYTGTNGITVSGGTISYTDDAELVNLTVVTAVSWDETSKQLKMTTVTLPVKVQKDYQTTPVQTVIFTATSHADEHAGEDDN